MHSVGQLGQPSPPTMSYSSRFSIGDFVDYRLSDDESEQWKLGVLIRFVPDDMVEVQIGDTTGWHVLVVSVDEDHLRLSLSSMFDDDD